MRHPVLELVVELDGERDQRERQQGRQRQFLGRIVRCQDPFLSLGFAVSIRNAICENRSPSKNFDKARFDV
jgi:hypothetical protein